MIAPNGNRAMSITFTQTGCAVTGSGIITRHGCPITYTGTVDSTGALSGTWKAYCDLDFGSIYTSQDNTADNGVFNLNMEPGGSTFIGEMMVHTPDLDQSKAKECPNGNSNFAGKIISRSDQAASGTNTGSASSGGLTDSSTSGNSGTSGTTAGSTGTGTSGSTPATGSSVSASGVFGGGSYNWVEYKLTAVDPNFPTTKKQSAMDMYIKWTRNGVCSIRYSNPVQGMPASMDCSSQGVGQGDPNDVNTVPSGTTFTYNGPDSVTVPAGTFTANKYTTTIQDGSTETVWIANGGPVVKMTGSGSAGTVSLELNAQG